MLFVLPLLFVSCSSTVPSYKKIETPEELLSNYDEFCRIYDKYYPNFSISNTNWDSVKSVNRNKVLASKSENEFVGHLREIICSLKDPHGALVTPYDSTIFSKMLYGRVNGGLHIDSILEYSAHLSFTFQLIHNTPVVSFIDTAGLDFRNGLRPGMELIRINGLSVEGFCSRNFIQSYRAEATIEFLINSRLLLGNDNQLIHFVFLSGTTDTLQLSCRYSKKYNSLFFNPLITRYVAHLEKLHTLQYGRIQDSIGYINIATFIGEPSYSRRRTIFNTFKYDVNRNVIEFESALKKLSGTKGLIIDVRSNRGGDESIASTILSYFISKPVLHYTGKYRDVSFPKDYNKLTKFYTDSVFSFTEYHLHEFYMQYNGEYQKPVIVLQNEGSMSSTESFLSGVKNTHVMKTLGNISAGSTSNPAFYPLPNGMFVRVPRRQTFLNEDTLIEGNGIVPDFEVSMNKTDVVQGRDTQLEKAISILKNE